MSKWRKEELHIASTRLSPLSDHAGRQWSSRQLHPDTPAMVHRPNLRSFLAKEKTQEDMKHKGRVRVNNIPLGKSPAGWTLLALDSLTWHPYGLCCVLLGHPAPPSLTAEELLFFALWSEGRHFHLRSVLTSWEDTPTPCTLPSHSN